MPRSHSPAAPRSPRPRRRGPGRPHDPELAGRRRTQILEAATRLFAQRGYACTDLQDVADALSLGKGTLYRYFPSKSDLFQAALDRVMTEMRGAIDDAAGRAGDPLDQIALAIRRYLQFFRDHPHYVELLIQERAVFPDRKTPTYFVYRRANIARWNLLYRRLIAEGRVRPVPVERLTDTIGDLIYGTMFTQHLAPRPTTARQQADDIVNILFGGILTTAERSRRAVKENPQ